MTTHPTAAKAMPGWLIYLAYPILTAVATVTGNLLGQVTEPHYMAYNFTKLSLAGFLLIPAFLVHAIVRIGEARKTPHLFALGAWGIAGIAALQFVIVVILSDMAKIIVIFLIYVILGHLMGAGLGPS